MYNNQWDEEDDDKNSLNSSFWSDDEAEEEEVIESKPVDCSLSLLLGTSGEKNLKLNSQKNITGEVLKVDSDDDDDEISSSSSGSPAPSLMTSGYGTFRVEEQQVGDHGNDQDSQSDLCETRDDEVDCLSLCSFVEFDTEAISDPDPSGPVVCLLANVVFSEDAAALEQINITDTKPEGEEEQTKEKEQQCNMTKSKLEEHHLHVDGDQEEETELKEQSEQELQHLNVTSRLEEQMAELDLCTSAQEDFDTESEYVTDQSETQSSDTDGVSLSAFKSYIRGMTRSQSDGDIRPKPKSFIRPVLSQQTIKKTDPVTKYFQYKQMWEMFKLPGESDRKALRWEIKERLAYQPPPPKPGRVYVPNTYIVPTDKKRSALRWQIRNDLANGLLPQRFNDQF